VHPWGPGEGDTGEPALQSYLLGSTIIDVTGVEALSTPRVGPRQRRPSAIALSRSPHRTRATRHLAAGFVEGGRFEARAPRHLGEP